MSNITQFKKGQSGNPDGRPKGTGMTAKLRNAIANDLPDIIGMLTNAAKAGDVQAAKVLLDKCLPNIKSVSAPVTIPMDSATSLAQKAHTVLEAATKGEISPDDATALITALSGLARIVEIDELEQRLNRLEKQQELKK